MAQFEEERKQQELRLKEMEEKMRSVFQQKVQERESKLNAQLEKVRPPSGWTENSGRTSANARAHVHRCARRLGLAVPQMRAEHGEEKRKLEAEKAELEEKKRQLEESRQPEKKQKKRSGIF